MGEILKNPAQSVLLKNVENLLEKLKECYQQVLSNIEELDKLGHLPPFIDLSQF